MSAPGLALVGFLPQDQGINYLRNACITKDSSDGALGAEWTAAAAKLGDAIPKAGNPDLQDIPLDHPHIQALLQSANAPAILELLGQGASFKCVEIDPLLAFQFSIDTSRSDHHCNGLPENPTPAQLMELCLPQTPQSENYAFSLTAQSAIVRSKSLNIRLIQAGMPQNGFMGLIFGTSLPFEHVVRFNGRCYLHNGFHRAWGIRKAGATHMPCIFREVADGPSAGINENGTTFPLALLESANPPTLAHFTLGRAWDVTLRSMTRLLHVSWAEYAVPEEF